MRLMALSVAVELVTFSQFEFTWLTVERVAEMVGASIKNPAPAVTLPPRNEMPRSSSGLNPADRVSSTSAVSVWNGKAFTLDLSLFRSVSL